MISAVLGVWGSLSLEEEMREKLSLQNDRSMYKTHSQGYLWPYVDFKIHIPKPILNLRSTNWMHEDHTFRTGALIFLVAWNIGSWWLSDEWLSMSCHQPDRAT